MVESNERSLLQDDVYIAVLGLTGTGKSTFVARCAGRPLPQSGHGLESDTTSITIQSFVRNGKTVHLIDTPGFDDDRKDDATIMQELAFWLLQAHRTGFALSGLVFLHRITDNHLQGSALRALKVFKALCGVHCYPGVVMATTRWDEINDKAGCNRQLELVSNGDFWGDIIEGGGKVLPLHWNNASALAIVDSILANHQRLTLDIQTELASGRISLHETSAGRIVYEDYHRLKQQWEQQIQDTTVELNTAIRKHHDRNQLECRAEIGTLQQSVSLKSAALQALRATGDQLISSWLQNIARDMGVVNTAAHQNTQQLQRLEESRLQLAKDTRERSNGIQTSWNNPQYESLIRANQQGKLAGQFFKDPAQVGAMAGVVGAYLGFGSFAMAAQQATAGTSIAAILGPAAILCNVM
ncbi:hypothetical protein CC86DRAFT_360083 [Ophiobolus disseminans]|uniref:G domain-containing protein n=1 Tax=Ophiobolus disseminans TaxID=1469910 RepID=A0A6A6ZJG7_9PLEO|nr:hypothetical protein CC86DRAFT_360083 [Ophiobolus disseminans]